MNNKTFNYRCGGSVGFAPTSLLNLNKHSAPEEQARKLHIFFIGVNLKART